jgi:hypothetical protein
MELTMKRSDLIQRAVDSLAITETSEGRALAEQMKALEGFYRLVHEELLEIEEIIKRIIEKPTVTNWNLLKVSFFPKIRELERLLLAVVPKLPMGRFWPVRERMVAFSRNLLAFRQQCNKSPPRGDFNAFLEEFRNSFIIPFDKRLRGAVEDIERQDASFKRTL